MNHPLCFAGVLFLCILLCSAGCIHYTETPQTPIPDETVSPTATVPVTAVTTAVPSAAVTATPKPAQTQMPSHQIDGSGTSQTWEIWLDTGVSTVQAHNYENGNFIVWLTKGGVHQDLLFNELNAWEGSTAFEVREPGYYTFDVIASGTWTLTVDGPYASDSASFTRYRSNGILFITGANSMTTQSFPLEKGIAVFNGYYLGTDHVSATLYANGVSAGTLDSDQGPAKTQVAYPVLVNGSYTLNVNTAGSWGFEITQPIPVHPGPLTFLRGTGDEVTQYYTITGDLLLSLSNSGKNPATLVFYTEDGTVAGDVVVPAGSVGFEYLLQNPNGYKTITCLVAVTADGTWTVSATRD